MAWSTREIAQLAGTTVRAVRHHHEIGLLDEPRRRTNGYKQYGVAHLVRALRIKRLTDLGFSLPQIAEMGDTDRHPRQALRRLDTELAETLERVRRVRADLRQILSQAAPTDLPAELAAAICDMDLSDADRSLLVVMSRVLERARPVRHPRRTRRPVVPRRPVRDRPTKGTAGTQPAPPARSP